jgi:RNA recognition motif-containing protein
MSKIFVGNLSFQTTQEELLATFSQFGNVEQINIVTDRDTGQPRGFAFVAMTNAQDAQKAIAQLNGAELHGRALNVNEARSKLAVRVAGKDSRKPRGRQARISLVRIHQSADQSVERRPTRHKKGSICLVVGLNR